MDEMLKKIEWDDCYKEWSEELRYFMYRYDEYLSSDTVGINQGQWNKIWQMDVSKSIEHILPQSSKAKYVHHIGNLTMLPPGMNSSLGQKSPKMKSSSYLECGLKGTIEVAKLLNSQNGKWGRRQIMLRAKNLEKFVQKQWG
jgi:Protein of unknown function (DUF1524)